MITGVQWALVVYTLGPRGGRVGRTENVGMLQGTGARVHADVFVGAVDINGETWGSFGGGRSKERTQRARGGGMGDS